jgi:hypothetical protein
MENCLEGYKKQIIEENSTDWENRLEEANDRYTELESRYWKETHEWQDLLDMYMTKTIEESEQEGKEFFRSTASTNQHQQQNCDEMGFLSPIPREASMLEPNTNNSKNQWNLNESSSIPFETILPSSSSMENIDNLMEELSKMDAERTAILEEINQQEDTEADERALGISQLTSSDKKSDWYHRN